MYIQDIAKSRHTVKTKILLNCILHALKWLLSNHVLKSPWLPESGKYYISSTKLQSKRNHYININEITIQSQKSKYIDASFYCTVCPGSSDPPEKILNIFASENKVYTIF